MIHPDQLELYESQLKAEPKPEPAIGAVGQATLMARYMACAEGNHVWVPWLRLDNDSFVTWCIHCKWQESYDV